MPPPNTAAPPSPMLPPTDFPLHTAAARALEAAAHPPDGWQPLGYTAADYLDLLRAICASFQPFQDEHGAILDPFADEEKQYATPCYAVAAALAALDGRPPAGVWGATRRGVDEAPSDPVLLESAALAQDHALRALAVDKNTAQNHADFFAPLVVIAYHLLAPFVGRERAARWLAELRSIDPETTYRNTFTWQRDHGRPPAVHNWNVVAVAGEILRHAAGAGSALAWVQGYLTYQLREHCDLTWGLYRDPNCPLPYDLFPRHHLSYALASLPDSSLITHHSLLAAWLHRGEWTSALTQTASGGIPPGWRSSEHLWNDAALVALAEVAAARHACAGEMVAAGLFRRVATLACRDVLHWRRPSGELHVVKNHFDPAERFGFEGYSFHSNYGLYPAAMIATAILFGDCHSPERPAPVETGGYVVRYPDPFHRLTATGAGMTLAFDLDADGHYDVTGLNSVRCLHRHPLLGPAAGIPAHPRYHVPAPAGVAYAPGLAWSGPGGAPVSLAGLRPERVDLHVARQDADVVDFTLTYVVADAGCDSTASRYRLTAGSLDVEETFAGTPSAAEALAFTWPFPADDGRDRSIASIDGSTLRIRLGDSLQEVTCLDAGSPFEIVRDRVAYRNGYAGVARVKIAGSRARWQLRYR